MSGCFALGSGYRIRTNFSDTYSCSRPKAALHVSANLRFSMFVWHLLVKQLCLTAIADIKKLPMSFFNELKRRNVIRVGIAYVVVCWLVLQFADVVLDNIDAPSWVFQVIMLVLAIGLPLVLVFAWAFEMTPDGIKKERDVDRSQSITPRTGQKLNNAILALMAVGIAYLLYDKFSVEGPDPIPAPANGMAENSTSGKPDPALDINAEAAPAIKRQSIAVLPFANRSNREEDQFFTDGIHDDLLTTIARIGSMKVISRTSVMEYKNTTKNIRQIAKELGVTNILEGGIQRSGNQIRINVQLIDAITDEHLWAEIFDRELTAENLFAIQSEISQKIADALEATLTPSEKDRINRMPTDNLEAFSAYIRGRQLMATRESGQLEQATAEFNQAVELDPNFALAWVGVADSHFLWMLYGTPDRQESLEIMETAITRALIIDDQLGEAYATLAQLESERRENEKTETAFKRAIELNPNYATAYHWYSNWMGDFPLRAQEQIQMGRKAVELDPRSAIIGATLGAAYIRSGFYSKAERQLQKVLELKPRFVQALGALSSLYSATSRYDLSMKYSRMAAEQDPGNPDYLRSQAYIYLAIGEFEKSDQVRQQLEELAPGELGNGYFDTWASLVRGNKAAAREGFNWTLPRAQEYDLPLEQFGDYEVALGTNESARELYLQSNPGWLEPAIWQTLVEQQQNRGCTFAWLLSQTGDTALAEQLARYTTKYLTEDLPAAIEHADRNNATLCYLVTGDYEHALNSLETLTSHGHLNYYRTFDSQFPVFDPIRHLPRYQQFLSEYDRQIEVQRLAVAKLDAEAGP